MPINFSEYTNPFVQRAELDTDPIFKYAQYNLQQKMHSDQVAHQNRVAGDINTRFAIEQGDKTTGREFEYQQQNRAKTDKLLMAARTAVAKGDWNLADSLIGPLAELGVRTNRQLNSEGKPVYEFEAPHLVSPTGETYESAAEKLNNQYSSTNHERLKVNTPGKVNQSSPDTTTQDIIEQPQAAPQAPTTRSEVQSQTTPDTNGDTPQQNPFDPFKLDTSEFARTNAMRLDPVLSGLRDAFPNEFQPLVGNYLDSLKSLNQSPESTMDTMQKSLDTLGRLYGAKLNAEANMARASIGASGAEATDAFRREQAARGFSDKNADAIQVQSSISNKLQFETIRQKINAKNNPNANAEGIKQLISLYEGSRITDKDFDIAATGYASGWDTVRTQLERTYVTGLTDLQRLRFNQMLDISQREFDKRIMEGSRKLITLKNSYRYEPERYAVMTYIRGNIPEQFWDEETKNFDPLKYQGGMPSKTQVKSGVNASVSGPSDDDETDAAIRNLLGE